MTDDTDTDELEYRDDGVPIVPPPDPDAILDDRDGDVSREE